MQRNSTGECVGKRLERRFQFRRWVHVCLVSSVDDNDNNFEDVANKDDDDKNVDDVTNNDDDDSVVNKDDSNGADGNDVSINVKLFINGGLESQGNKLHLNAADF